MLGLELGYALGLGLGLGKLRYSGYAMNVFVYVELSLTVRVDTGREQKEYPTLAVFYSSKPHASTGTCDAAA